MRFLRIAIAFIVVMGLWSLWDQYVVEDSMWKYLALVVAAISIYFIELAIVGRKSQ